MQQEVTVGMDDLVAQRLRYDKGSIVDDHSGASCSDSRRLTGPPNALGRRWIGRHDGNDNSLQFELNTGIKLAYRKSASH
jgi:hypothetical protein